ncbi:peptidoglycan DD-metalloendopeptidase family protein [Luteimicrobium subarcticum]|uniref:SH3 domain-containing protein n=1 Tax=Luteimicrobium subarcticum TaxID=620910 RepID=A0A2M8WJ04_9MICO|nr:peptidoglycan DD-metalloendopeptidase family protein [Luteimicrobium subarcticum]PJI90917.1 SH3 domain-containing protein [Luteimicrobium subarcticum]
MEPQTPSARTTPRTAPALLAALAAAAAGLLALVGTLVAPPAEGATRVVLPLRAETFSTSSMYGPRCLPVADASAWHLGVDLEAQYGAPIYAVAAGTVTHAVDPTGGEAGYVMIRHTINGIRYDTVYLHMEDATRYVHAGQKVAAGQRIALVGSSGPATSPHLHLEVWKGGWGATAVNPVTFFVGHGVSLGAARIFDQGVRIPATCTYYATARLNVRSAASSTARVVRTVAQGTAMRSQPGKKTNGFVPVTVGSTHGWVSASYVSPTSTSWHPTYVTRQTTFLRKGPGLQYATVRKVAAGTRITTVYAVIGDWRDVSVGGVRGLVKITTLRLG